MAQKSILEQALLQVQTLEEAVKANAKGILASTMKQELNDLLKEEEEDNLPDKEEKDVPAEAGDDETSISDEPKGDEEPDNDADDANPELEDKPEGEFPAADDDMGAESDDDDTLDMTGASEEEVLKVFKAMKPEDGIVVKKEGNTVQFSDQGNDYIIKLDDEGSEEPESTEMPDGAEMPDGLAEQSESANQDEIVYEIELDDDDDSQEMEATEEVSLKDGKPFDQKSPKGGVKKLQANETVTVTKSVTTKDGQPFNKKSPQQGVKKLQANEETIGGAKRPGTPLKGTGGPETKEPGKGGEKATQAEPHDGTPVKGTKPAEKKEPGKGGTKVTQTEKHPGTPPKGEGKPVVKEPKEQFQTSYEEECKECGDKDVKEVEATEAARTKWNIHGDKGGGEPGRTGLKSKKLFATGGGQNMGVVAEEVETLRKQNAEYKKALILFKDKLNEVAVFNANLAYATRLFTEHSTTKQEKLNILKRFDSISTITESKNLYATIQTELETKKPISEAMVEKIASTPQSSSTEVLSESKAYESPQFARMKELMKKLNR
jgi:hypothetical protein